MKASTAESDQPRAKHVLLLGATFGTGNMGVGALAAGALAVIDRAYPDAAVSFLDYGREPCVASADVGGRRLKIPLVNLRFSWRVYLRNNVAYLLLVAAFLRFVSPGLRSRLIARNRWLTAIEHADVAVAVSGGDSFSDIYGMGRYLYVILPQVLVVMMGRRLIMLPQTIGPFATRLARHSARWLMSRADRVFSRDREGVKEAKALLAVDSPDSRIRFCYDMGFVVEPHKPMPLDLGGLTTGQSHERLLVGLNVSGLLLMGGYGGGNMFALAVDYRTLVEEIVRVLIEEIEADVLLIPHVFGVHEESDTVAVAQVHSALVGRYPGRLFAVCGDYFDQHEIKYIIGQCDFFIGSRMHACIAALSQCIPAVGVAYSRKFLGVLESIGVGRLVADSRGQTVEATVDVIRQAVRQREQIREHLQGVMPGVREAILSVLSEPE